MILWADSSLCEESSSSSSSDHVYFSERRARIFPNSGSVLQDRVCTTRTYVLALSNRLQSAASICTVQRRKSSLNCQTRYAIPEMFLYSSRI